MQIELISIGTELLGGKLNSDSSFIGEHLGKIGLELSRESTIGDEKKKMISLLRESLKRAEIVITTGGLGPTFDDLTREAVSEALRRRLIFRSAILKKMREHFQKRHLSMPEVDRKQAYIIEGATVVPNDVGTAPGMIIETKKDGKRKVLILLPGPPRELQPMFIKKVLPYLKRFSKGSLRTISFWVAGLPESSVAEKVEPIIEKYQKKGLPAGRQEEIEFAILVHLSIIEVKLKIRGKGERINEQVSLIKEEIRKALGENLFSEKDGELEKIVGNLLLKKKLKLGLAESCTGGLLGNLITNIPGSSHYFQGSIVAYSNNVKKKVLKVPKTYLRKYGAVSREVALAMAEGARKSTKADTGLSLTGITGPSGGTKEKPVGLLFVGLVYPKKRVKIVKEYHFVGKRQDIKQRAAISALDLLRRSL